MVWQKDKALRRKTPEQKVSYAKQNFRYACIFLQKPEENFQADANLMFWKGVSILNLLFISLNLLFRI